MYVNLFSFVSYQVKKVKVFLLRKPLKKVISFPSVLGGKLLEKRGCNERSYSLSSAKCCNVNLTEFYVYTKLILCVTLYWCLRTMSFESYRASFHLLFIKFCCGHV